MFVFQSLTLHVIYNNIKNNPIRRYKYKVLDFLDCSFLLV